MEKLFNPKFLLLASFILLCLSGLTYFVLPTNWLDNLSPTRKKEMIQLTLEWGRLAPFPTESEDFTISTSGSSFTRSFAASFRASPEIINQWVSDSPGLANVEPDHATPGIRRYSIIPGGGANLATVEIDDRINLVKIYVSWS